MEQSAFRLCVAPPQSFDGDAKLRTPWLLVSLVRHPVNTHLIIIVHLGFANSRAGAVPLLPDSVREPSPACKIRAHAGNRRMVQNRTVSASGHTWKDMAPDSGHQDPDVSETTLLQRDQ
jgi:hypothetical protein